MAEEEEGGFDVEFVDALPDDLTCIVCHLALRDPVQVANCGHRFCTICFKKFESFSKERNAELSCPVDRNKVDKNLVFTDVAASRAILSLQVKCEQHTNGCTWVGELRYLHQHLEKSCEKRVTKLSPALESQMNEISKRMEECEQCISSQNQQIHSLQESVQQKDAKINFLQNDVERQLQKKKEEIELLKSKIHTLEENKSFHNNIQQLVQSYIESREQKLTSTEARVLKIETINPKMGAFDWLLDNYSHQSESSDCVRSLLFHNYLNGHVCQLSLQWFNRRKSRIGVYFHIPNEENEHISTPFHMKVVIQCVGENNIQKTCVLTDWIQSEESVSEEGSDPDMSSSECEGRNKPDVSSCKVVESAGDEYFLSQPELDRFIVNDRMHFICYLI